MFPSSTGGSGISDITWSKSVISSIGRGLSGSLGETLAAVTWGAGLGLTRV